MADAHTGMGPLTPAPKLDPHCQCVCHTQPGVMHVAACCTAPDLIPRADAERAALEAKTEMAALLGITCARDTMTGEPIMWGDADGDCLTPEVAVQCALEKIKRDAALARVEKLRLQLDQKDALYDSAYQAGVKVGWNLGVSDDEAGFRAATSSTEHVAELKRIRADFARADADALAEVQQLREELSAALTESEKLRVQNNKFWKANLTLIAERDLALQKSS